MRRTILFYVILSSVWGFSQTEDELIKEIKDFQSELNIHYFDKETSPLKKRKQRKKFKGHNFYDIDLDYRVKAKVVRIESTDTVVMPTSAGTNKYYTRWAKLQFEVKGTACELIAYRSAKADDNYLFIPFKDATSGKESYGGGRYLDLDIPEGEHVMLNFNLAYNPYCAYTTGWYCPIPPAENTLKVAVRAGLMKPTKTSK